MPTLHYNLSNKHLRKKEPYFLLRNRELFFEAYAADDVISESETSSMWLTQPLTRSLTECPAALEIRHLNATEYVTNMRICTQGNVY